MYIELTDKTATHLRALLVKRLRAIEEAEKSVSRKRSWRPSERAMALGELSMDRETLTALQRALRSPADLARQESDSLTAIRNIIEAVDNRAMAADGPVTPTLKEMTQAEMSEIYKLAGGKPGK